MGSRDSFPEERAYVVFFARLQLRLVRGTDGGEVRYIGKWYVRMRYTTNAGARAIAVDSCYDNRSDLWTFDEIQYEMRNLPDLTVPAK